MGRVLPYGEPRAELIAAASARGIAFVSGAADADLALDGCMPHGARPKLVVVTGGEAAVIRALDRGADDAVDRGSSDALIAARLGALLRRAAATRVLRLGDLALDPIGRRVIRAGRPIALRPREYDVLVHLLHHAGEVVGRAALYEAVWRLRFDPGTHRIEVHVSRLRDALDDGFDAPMLLTEKGAGYRLVAADSAVAGGGGAV